MKLLRHTVVFDAADLAAESTFWAALVDGSVDFEEDDWHTVHIDGEPFVAFQLAPNHVKPDWPDGEPQQVHLDLHIEDIVSGHEQAIALGAVLLRAAPDIHAGRGYQVYADPAGHPFCLCWE